MARRSIGFSTGESPLPVGVVPVAHPLIPPMLPGDATPRPVGPTSSTIPYLPPSDPASSNTNGNGSGNGNGHNPLHIPGFHPDYGALVRGDPLYQQGMATFGADEATAGTNRRGGIQRLIAQFGMLPQNFTDTYGDIDATTRGAADANTAAGTSTYANLNHAHTQALSQLANAMAARGILSSGDTGSATHEEGLRNNNAFSSAVGNLFDSLSTINSNYAGTVGGIHQDEAGLAQNTATRLSGLPQYQDRADTTATWDDTNKAYKDPYGNLYDESGNMTHAYGTY